MTACLWSGPTPAFQTEIGSTTGLPSVYSWSPENEYAKYGRLFLPHGFKSLG